MWPARGSWLGVLTGTRIAGYVVRHTECSDPGVFVPRQAGPDDDLREVSARAGSRFAYTSSGARMFAGCGHEDFPCCGCDS